ncbi:MAG TPA: hypothetical protein QF355_00080 [Candidatus Marinimicrobia bacterium]|jgi:ABC-type sulfate transport system substrate-binding protein|nr:hypothetical protein [Candidatus Neomarinimicrobiota bacterium]MDP6261102.1 hypothetical protein [Candidatus Neomarinimicrobiota bacterium]MDP7127144.1 hypothetical protein [Candidatus Neomarinimicrobiota bacterium]MDP7336566.1 hypothetical protein [Candidatus Neomarinimicrobiota bacterium]MDP7475674.1 hypothetical protein [Candidatus Neomarinimicrobiota bacterium]|tara:strand:- start:1335 stop:1760 length:426 start_codon:yes stop_codon:yes gene_type:complete
MDNNNEPKEVQPEELQKSYLLENFETIIEQIGEGYGAPLQEELIRRMEKTVAEFHEDVSDLVVQLKEQSEKRQNTLKQMLSSDDQEIVDEIVDEVVDIHEEKEMSDYERRLENMDSPKKDDQDKTGDQKKEKRGFFKRKKK